MERRTNSDQLEDISILNKIEKRLDHIELKNRELINIQKNQQRILLNQRNIQKDEITKFKDECKELENKIHNLKIQLFQSGKQLKEKITKNELEYVTKEISDWKLEEYITKKELNKAYENYSK